MQLQFLGATGTVTGSRYLVHTKQTNVLVDCGLFEGYKQLRLRNWNPFPVAPAALDAVVLTHAHLDQHADQAGIMSWIANFNVPPKQTFITHGEPDAADALRHHLEERLH